VTAFYIFIMLLGLIVALYDMMFYKIPNILVLALTLLAIPHLVFFAKHDSLYLTLGISISFLMIGFICTRFGWMGAGDAKLLSVSALWVAPTHIPAMILVMAIFGAFLALVYMTLGAQIDHLRKNLICFTHPLMSKIPVLKDYYQNEFIPSHSSHKLKTPIPYGVAISLALVYILLIRIGALS